MTYNNNKDPITFKQDLVAMLAIAILVPSFIWALITAPLVVAATLATNWTVGLYIFFHLKRKGQAKEWDRQQKALEADDGPRIMEGLIDDGYVDDGLVYACTKDELLEDLTEDK